MKTQNLRSQLRGVGDMGGTGLVGCMAHNESNHNKAHLCTQMDRQTDRQRLTPPTHTHTPPPHHHHHDCHYKHYDISAAPHDSM